MCMHINVSITFFLLWYWVATIHVVFLLFLVILTHRCMLWLLTSLFSRVIKRSLIVFIHTCATALLHSAATNIVSLFLFNIVTYVIISVVTRMSTISGRLVKCTFVLLRGRLVVVYIGITSSTHKRHIRTVVHSHGNPVIPCSILP